LEERAEVSTPAPALLVGAAMSTPYTATSFPHGRHMLSSPLLFQASSLEEEKEEVQSIFIRPPSSI